MVAAPDGPFFPESWGLFTESGETELGLKKASETDKAVRKTLKRIRPDLKVLMKITDDSDKALSVLCETARNGARKLLMAKRISD